MSREFLRNLAVAVSVFLLVAVVVYTNLTAVEPITEYVEYVVSTDFSLKPVLAKSSLFQKVANWNFEPLIETWLPVSGR